MVDQGKSKAQPKQAAIIFAVIFAIIAIWFALLPKTPREQTYEEKLCDGKTQFACFEALETERARREWLESPEGQSFLKAQELAK